MLVVSLRCMKKGVEDIRLLKSLHSDAIRGSAYKCQVAIIRELPF